jgi:ABC-2 type transport system ATP-binding protein
MVVAMTALLEIENVTVRRGRHLAVSGFTYSISGAGWFGIIGANGSGKTTLLQALAGRLEVASGTLILNGVDVTRDRFTRAAHLSLALEAAHLPDDLSPRELYAIIKRTPDYATPEPKFAEVWAALGIPALLDLKIAAMSSGMRQRVALYAAFIDHDEDIIILDEPFNWLDPLAAHDLKRALKTLADAGMTLITALHDVSTLAVYCTQGLLMSDGKIALTLGAEDFVAARYDIAGFEQRVVAELRKNNGAA